MNTYRLNTKLITNMSSVLLMPVTRIRKDADLPPQRGITSCITPKP